MEEMTSLWAVFFRTHTPPEHFILLLRARCLEGKANDSRRFAAVLASCTTDSVRRRSLSSFGDALSVLGTGRDVPNKVVRYAPKRVSHSTPKCTYVGWDSGPMSRTFARRNARQHSVYSM